MVRGILFGGVRPGGFLSVFVLFSPDPECLAFHHLQAPHHVLTLLPFGDPLLSHPFPGFAVDQPSPAAHADVPLGLQVHETTDGTPVIRKNVDFKLKVFCSEAEVLQGI